MSLVFDWDTLSEGATKGEIKDFLNSLVRRLELPKFIKNLEINEIEFGHVPPKVNIVDVTEPLSEFYFPAELGMEQPEGVEELFRASEGMSASEETDEGSDDIMASFLDTVRDEKDFQVELFVEYSGDMRMIAGAELSADGPFENFISLPISLTLSEVSVHGTAILAFIGDRINLCFKEPPEDGGSIIRNIKVESEIGNKDVQVLKNIDRIEKYIVSSIRKLLEDRLMFPNSHSFIMT